MQKDSALGKRDDTQLSAGEYDLLMQFVTYSARPVRATPVAEQELLTSLTFAMKRVAQQC